VTQHLGKLITERYSQAREFDNTIASDTKRYTSWVLGIATAGFALAMTQQDKILDKTGGAGTLILNCVAAVFMLSALVGALVVRYIDLKIAANREIVSLLFRQEILLAGEGESSTRLGRLQPQEAIAAVCAGEFLGDKRARYDELRTKLSNAGKMAGRLFIAQHVLVACGYLAIFVVATCC